MRMESRVDEVSLEGTALGHHLQTGEFVFQKLVISGIDNKAILSKGIPGMPDREYNLFHKSISSGDDYVALLARRFRSAMENRQPFPVARFADGEYAFYAESLKCNGLYKQAESVDAIRSALPFHISALRELSKSGMLAPLVYAGNIRRPNLLHRLFGRRYYDDEAPGFLEFLKKQDIALTGSNYVPFYVVYAYFSSPRFAEDMDGRTICIVNPDFNLSECTAWFAKAASFPRLYHVPIADSYVATQWKALREKVVQSIPERPDCFFVGAGVGALEVCIDLGRHFSVPAIDAGHILNVMNGLQSKSGGHRLFTHQ